MTTFELPIGKHGRSRIWLQDLPNCLYPVCQTVDHHLPAVGNSGTTELFAAMELGLPLDASSYGLLGARFVPEENGELTIRVEASTSDGVIMADSLAHGNERTRVGLALEYVAGVMDGAVMACMEGGLGPGTLTFNCAAHSDVGSSLVMFRRLAAIVVKLLPLEANTAPETVAEIVQSVLRSRAYFSK